MKAAFLIALIISMVLIWGAVSRAVYLKERADAKGWVREDRSNIEIEWRKEGWKGVPMGIALDVAYSLPMFILCIGVSFVAVLDRLWKGRKKDAAMWAVSIPVLILVALAVHLFTPY